MDGIAIFSAFLQGLGIVAFAVRLNELAVTRSTSPQREIIATAMTFMVGALVSMAFPLKFVPGVAFDLRHVFLVLAGPFGGWPAALLTSLATSAYRFAQGGPTVYADLSGIVVAALLGLAIARFNRRPDYSLAMIATLGVAASVPIFGTFLVVAPYEPEAFRNLAIPFVLANFIGVIISAESFNRIRVQMHREKALVRDTATDPLTGLSNRRAFDAQGPELAEDGIQKNGRYALMIVDIDRFKSINDTFGHANGDKVIKQVAETVSTYARDNDMVVRYGGEEIALVLPGCDETRTAVIADRIREGIEHTTFEVNGINLKVTVSVGYVVVDAPGKGFWSAFEEADAALYRAKTAGRNRVEKALAA